jgi:integrase
MARHTGIRKLPNGRFRARYFAGYDSGGKRKYPAKTFDTQSAAITWRSEQISAKSPGQRCDGHGMTVSQWLDRWLHLKKQTIRDNSWGMYQATIDNHIKPGIGEIRLARLTATQIETMQSELLKRLSPNTVLTARGMLNMALQKAVKLGLIRINPVSLTDGPKRKKPDLYPVSIDEALRFNEACNTSRFGLYFQFAIAVGLRPEEGVALKWSDLDLGSRGTVHIRRVIHTKLGGGWKWQETKSDSGRRVVVFSGDMAMRLTNHRKAQLEQKLRAGSSWQNHDLVFTTKYGAPIFQCALRKEIKKILESAGLSPKIRLYDLRHFFVSASLLAGVDVKTVSAEAGHANAGFTLKTYGHVLEEAHIGASDKREELLRKRQK